MIGGLSWSYEPVHEEWRAKLDARELRIGWDEQANSLYLGVNVPAPANVEGALPRSYITDIPLLVALLLLPGNFHGPLVKLVEMATEEVRDTGIVGPMGEVVEKSIEGHPATLTIVKRLAEVNKAAKVLETLAEQLATQNAFKDTV